MAKFLLFALVLAVAYLLWRASRHRVRPPAPLPEPEEMARCAQCGVHFPRVEAVVRDGREFCCEDHSRLRGNP